MFGCDFNMVSDRGIGTKLGGIFSGYVKRYTKATAPADTRRPLRLSLKRASVGLLGAAVFPGSAAAGLSHPSSPGRARRERCLRLNCQ